MKVYRIRFREYVETDEYIGGPTYNLEWITDHRLFSSEEIAKKYAEYAKLQDGCVDGYEVYEQEVIDKF